MGKKKEEYPKIDEWRNPEIYKQNARGAPLDCLPLPEEDLTKGYNMVVWQNRPDPPERVIWKDYTIFQDGDGKDCAAKIFRDTLLMGWLGFSFSFLEQLAISKPPTWLARGSKFIGMIGPMAGAGLAYGSTVCMMAHLRNYKDDTFNHIPAGFVAGAIFGARFKSQKLGIGLGLAFATAGAFMKMAHKERMYFGRRELYGNQREVMLASHMYRNYQGSDRY